MILIEMRDGQLKILEKLPTSPSSIELILDVLEALVHGATLGAMYAMVAAGLALMLGVARPDQLRARRVLHAGRLRVLVRLQRARPALPAGRAAGAAVMLLFGLVYQRTVIARSCRARGTCSSSPRWPRRSC
jgi:branched-subunit amino acid ABC-type transport system permease component